MWSAGGERRDKGGQDADHLRPQILVVNQKRCVKNVSRTEGGMVGKN
jgi:hypothetical protein